MTDKTFLIHLGGKIEINSKIPLKTLDDLSMAYTPGVARVCKAIDENHDNAFQFTIKNNMVAVITDGTAVLGLGDIGPLAALPVMEGKAMLFKELANVNAFPICLDTKNVDEIIQTIKNIAPGFGGINLEDISAPRCFEIENRLQEELDIPVFHDDQHGTAVVVTAALMNAVKIVNKKMTDLKVVVAGVGAAGTACTKMLLDLGIKNIIGCDRQGVLYKGKLNLDAAKQSYTAYTNPNNEKGDIHDAIKGADVFLGLSGPGIIDQNDIKNMANDPIVFALSNPTPEIMPELAQPYATVIATGRSDYPNQINNVLCFPGLFRGLLDCMACRVTEEIKMAAAKAIAEIVKDAELRPDYIIPSVFNSDVAVEVAKAVIEAAKKTGVSRHHPQDYRKYLENS